MTTENTTELDGGEYSVVRFEDIGRYIRAECPVCASPKVTIGADGRAKPTINCPECNTKSVVVNS